MLVISLLTIFFAAIGTAVCQSTGLCSEQNRASNLQACLNAIGIAAIDPTQFWFGTDYYQRCPQGPLTPGFGCFLPKGFQIPESMSSLVFTPGTFDPVTLDRYIDITFTSPEGNYYACGNNFEFTEAISFTLDPLSSTTYFSWDAREMPEMTWAASPDELFSLVVYDVPYGFIHGVYINIPGNDITRSEVVDPYHGPKNPNRFGNPYVFLLYTQQQRITVESRFTERIPGQPFNVSEFAEIHSLSGPVAMNWLLAEGDAYAVGEQISWGVGNNCPMIVSDAAVDQGRPFLSGATNLSVLVNLTFNSTPISFRSCCEYFSEDFEMVSTNPIGDGFIRPVVARNEPHVELTIARISFIPANDSGKLYTLMMVDPDTPAPAAGTTERPLLHWLMINVPYDDVSKGNNVMSYLGPAPPDQKPHSYYFLLYEQTEPLTEESHRPYAGQSCSGRLLYRCLFDVIRFASDNSLKLVGASWFVSRRDEFVRYTYVQRGSPEEDQCGEVPGYRGDCLAMAGGSGQRASILSCITSAGVFFFLKLVKHSYL